MSDPVLPEHSPEIRLVKNTRSDLVVFYGAYFLSLALCFLVFPIYLHSTTRIHVTGVSDVVVARLENFDSRLNVLENRVQTLGDPKNNSPVTDAGNADAAHSAESAHLQADIAALSSAITALQAEVKATGATASEVREASAALVASVVAYIQLREAVASGHSYAEELGLLHDASKNDAPLLDLLSKLEPFATNGVPTIMTLHDELLQRRPTVAVIVAKSSAQHWWQRLLAELQGLITVRPLHGGEADALADLESAMARADITAALEIFKTLPNDAQKNLGDWQKNLEARQQADGALKNIVRHFANLTQMKKP